MVIFQQNFLCILTSPLPLWNSPSELSEMHVLGHSPHCVCVCVCVSHSVMSDSATPWTVARQGLPLATCPLRYSCLGFSRQEYWSGLPFPSPGDFPDPGPPALQVDSLPSELPGKPSPQ